MAFKANSEDKIETVTAASGELVRTVAVSGKVVAENSADLAFEIGGTVSAVPKKVGDSVVAGEVIASLDQAGLYANLLKAQADLSAAEAELAKLQGGAQSSAKLDTVKTATIQSIVDAYTTADDAIHNKVDQFFNNPRTVNPEIINAFKDYEIRIKINAGRVKAEDALNKWKALADDLTPVTYSSASLQASLSYNAQILSFLDEVSIAVSKLDTTTSLSQTTVDKYRADVAAARSAVNSAATSLIAQGETLNNTIADVPVQVAKVAAARANVANYQAALGDATIRAPFAGIISKQDAKIGQAVSPNMVLASVISVGRKIEGYVPEVSIAGLSLGNTAKVTLDAYGSDVVFDATVAHIDPAETIRDGVSNYKIELSFAQADQRIKPGMTANVTVETLRQSASVIVPARAVLKADGVKTVMVRASTTAESRVVETGISDSNGNIEIVSGLSAGEIILLDPTAK